MVGLDLVRDRSPPSPTLSLLFSTSRFVSEISLRKSLSLPLPVSPTLPPSLSP